MDTYRTNSHKLAGTNYSEVYPQAYSLYKRICAKTKRRPYIRSAYFGKEKVFLDYFWQHIRQKNLNDRVRRLKCYPCGLDLIAHSKVKPVSKENPNRRRDMLHRFSGVTSNGEQFFVQIMEDRKNGQKHFISVFPPE